jgi:hypothetical protein
LKHQARVNSNYTKNNLPVATARQADWIHL